jgi:hypothetical protein
VHVFFSDSFGAEGHVARCGQLTHGIAAGQKLDG